MFLGLFRRTPIPAWRFERSVFDLLSGVITDKKALGEELAGADNLNQIPPSENEKRQRMAAELYLLLERNISEEQTRNRIPRDILRERILRHCHADRAEGNFALLFLPHYERQMKLFERFTDMAFARARELMGEKEYADFMKFLSSQEPLFQKATDDGVVVWPRAVKRVGAYPPAVQRDSIQHALARAFGTLTTRLTGSMGELRVEAMLQGVYRRYHAPLDFIEDAAKPLVIVPDAFLENERIELLGKSELERALRMKSEALESTLAQVQGEKLKLSALSREELEKKVRERTAELLSSLRATEEARKNLEEFSSIAAHELRAPIAAIKGYINLLLTGPAGKSREQEEKYLGMMDRASERLLTLVNAILQVSRVELGTLAIEPAPVYLPDITDDVLAGLAAQVRGKKQKIVKEYNRFLPILDLDPSLMHAIIENLLSNAVKYTPIGGTITVSLAKKEPDAQIAVKDTGFGIPKMQQPRIFEKMFHADNVRAKEIEGTGLGLYLVKSILDQTGGKIWFESEEDRGTKFYVSIPLAGMQQRQGVKGLS